MNRRRIQSMLIRQWYGTFRSLDRLTDAFYWITIDLLLWGITAQYVQTLAGEVDVFVMITASVILWNVVYRSQADIGVSLLDELWNKNLINLFASPLTLHEWLASLLIFGVFKSLLALTFGSLVAFLLYHFMLFNLSWYLLPFIILLTMSGWWIGLVISGLILRYTTKIQALAWTFVWIMAPMSAIYFPVSALPPWVQSVVAAIPMSYVFEEMRRVLVEGRVEFSNLGIALVLNLLYLAAAYYFVRRSFARVLDRGLAKVY